MPSSYTTQLRLELPATGDLSGTWGTRVNSGITQMVEQAIAGRAVVSMTDADYTLTALNATSDEARCAVLRITGTLTANRNVICPTQPKAYVIENATTGGFSITVKTAAGSGIAIPTTKTYSVRCDGTNVVNATEVPDTQVAYLQAGTGATYRTLQAKLREQAISVRDFGAVGNGTWDDTPYVQACVDYCVANGKTVYFPAGYYLLTSTVTVTGQWAFIGDGIKSIVYVTSTSIPAFTFNINTTSVQFWSMSNFVIQGPLTTSTSSTAMRFIGDSTAYVSYGRCAIWVYGFGSAVKDEKTPRSTAFGLEGMLVWNRWEWTLLNQGHAGYWGTQGSGTGNQWHGTCVLNGAGARVLLFEGSGCVVGDIITSGHWGNQTAGGVGVEVGASTVYRAQIDLGAVQFDSNLDIPLKLSSTGAVSYTNISLQGNNLGGNAALGASLQPLRRSIIQDRDVSCWQAGYYLSTTVTVLTTTSIMDIDFAAWGGGNFRIVAAGLVGGVGSGVAVAEYDIRESSGALSVTSITNRLTGPAACAAITVTTAGTKATVKLTYTPASAGTQVNTTITGVGDNFKITRL